jgi:MFS family permease
MSRSSVTTASPTSVALGRARFAVGVLFFTNGALIANVVPRYPEIKSDLGLTNAAIGTAIAAYPLGALIAGLSASVLIRRFRSSRVAVAATLVTALGLLLAGVATGWLVLALALLLAGAMDAITDVAQNSHGLRVQRLYRRSIINSFHAVWSVGAVTGGVMGAAAAQLQVPLLVHLMISGVVFSAAALLAYRWLLGGPEPEPGSAPAGETSSTDAHAQTSAAGGLGAFVRYGVLLTLVVIASAGAVVEDAGSSWSAIYLSSTFEATAFVAGLGFISLQSMQFIGRLLGDRLTDRFGQRAVAQAGGVLILVGMGLALAFPTVAGTIAGFGVAGFGAATLIPAAMQNADELPGLRPGTGLAIVGWLLRLGFLVSPPLVGAVADASSLRLGLILVPVAGLMVLLFSRVLSTSTR